MSLINKNSENVVGVKWGTFDIKWIYQGTLLQWRPSTTTFNSTQPPTSTTIRTSTTQPPTSTFNSNQPPTSTTIRTSTTQPPTSTSTTVGSSNCNPDLTSGSSYVPTVESAAQYVQYRGKEYPLYSATQYSGIIVYAQYWGSSCDDPGSNLQYCYDVGAAGAGYVFGWQTASATLHGALTSRVETEIVAATQVQTQVKYEGAPYTYNDTTNGCYVYNGGPGSLYYCYFPNAICNNLSVPGWYTDLNNPNSGVTSIVSCYTLPTPANSICLETLTTLYYTGIPTSYGSFTYTDGMTYVDYIYDAVPFNAYMGTSFAEGDYIETSPNWLVKRTDVTTGVC